MDGTEIYEFLEGEFVATFLDELLPGIFHNYANPLNGIMGRSKLLQRRLTDFLAKLEQSYPDFESRMGVDYKKLISDINSINNESEKFYDLFRMSTGKFYAIGTHSVETLNLSTLIEAEMGFEDFYLDFKHNVRKEVHLDPDLPDISGITAYYSMSLWMLIRLAMENMKDEKDKAIYIATERNERLVFIKMTNLGNELVSAWKDNSANPDFLSRCTNGQKKIIYALLLLEQGSRGVEITYDRAIDMLAIGIPYRNGKEV